MIRRFNYTNRKKIDTADVQIELVPGPDSTKTFKARLSLGEYHLPAPCQVYVEAYENIAYMRFDFGTVAAVKEPPKDKLLLTEFEGSDAVRFRLKIVDMTGHAGQIVAEANAIIPRLPNEVEQSRVSLLPVRFAPLGEQAWCLQFFENLNEMPNLLVNNKVPDKNAFVRSPSFMALAYPAIVRQVLTHALADESEAEDDSWQAKWTEFGRSFLFSGEFPPEEDSPEEWIEDVVSAFCDRLKLFTHLSNSENGVA